MSDTESDDARFDRAFPGLAYLGRHDLARIPELKRVVERAARFRREHIDPIALDVDLRAGADPRYVDREFLRAASREGFFTITVPRLLGGPGLPLAAIMIVVEELAAGCLGLANLVSVHGLAVSTVAATGNLGGIGRLCEMLVAGERRDEPALLSTAITEPGAGTDAEDAELLKTARLSCEARPVSRGYLLSGRKVFISNGSLAAAHVVIMPTDRRRPVETMEVFLVPAGAKGLSIGRVEHKMGQRACPAAELVFEDCFVPEQDRLSGVPIARRGLELALGATRVGVGIFGTGAALGAYRRALAYARSHTWRGRPLAEAQWAQFRLTDMRRNVMLARSAYVEAMLANELFGLSGMLAPGKVERALGAMPEALRERLPVGDLLGQASVADSLVNKIEAMPEHQVSLAAALGSHAKVTGSDMGMANCELALDLMGADGLRHDRGMEKLYRDARLLQIYEGTNQLNRIEIHHRLVAPEATDV